MTLHALAKFLRHATLTNQFAKCKDSFLTCKSSKLKLLKRFAIRDKLYWYFTHANFRVNKSITRAPDHVLCYQQNVTFSQLLYYENNISRQDIRKVLYTSKQVLSRPAQNWSLCAQRFQRKTFNIISLCTVPLTCSFEITPTLIDHDHSV